MRHPLESALLKLDRARKHVDHFEAAFRTAAEADTYELIHEMDLEAGRYRISCPDIPAPAHLAAILGDAVQNARAALEHVIWGAVVYNLGREPPKPRDITFPIADTFGHFQKRPVLSKLTADQRAVVGSHQPYLRRGEHQHTALSLLRELSDIDKHRALAVLLHALRSDHDPLIGEPEFIGCGELIQPFIVTTSGALQPGTPLAEFRFTWLTVESRVNVEFNVVLEPAIREPDDRMRTLFPNLDKILWQVRKVIRDFEPFFAPLPLARKTLDARLHDSTSDDFDP